MSRLYQLDTSNQNLSEIKSASDQNTSLQGVFSKLEETIGNIRRERNHIMTANSNKKFNHTRNFGFVVQRPVVSRGNQRLQQW